MTTKLQKPVLVALAGPNGAGKTTFYHAHLKATALRFVNADVLAKELGLDAYGAARVADGLRRELLKQRISFVFETVFSDPVGEKLGFLKEAEQSGYDVTLCFVGVSGHLISEQRVAMRVTRGGHDVPVEKLVERYPRILNNLRLAIHDLSRVLVFDNDDLRRPFRKVAEFSRGRPLLLQKPIPDWLTDCLKKSGK